MFATYLQDQFQADYAREELVKEGKLSAKKADEQQEEWEEVRCYSFTCIEVEFELPPVDIDIEKAMMERVERPLLKSYLRFATPEDNFIFAKPFFVSNCFDCCCSFTKFCIISHLLACFHLIPAGGMESQS